MLMTFARPIGPAAAPPARRARSVRRTSTMLMSWPGGLGTPLHLDGRCRDLLTLDADTHHALDQAEVHARFGPDRTIEAISAVPDVETIAQLIGARGGANLRSAIDEAVPDHQAAGSPLYLLLDDLAGSSLIAGFAWFKWADRFPEFEARRRLIPPRSMQGICSGFRPGSSALLADGTMSGIAHQVQPVPSLADPKDLVGWHELDEHPEIAMRRARRIDVWIEDDTIQIDAMFRDSCWVPDGSEVAVHEYELHATADPSTEGMTSVEAIPRVLPYDECPGAAANATWLVGAPLRGLRSEVLERIRLTDCCTHLNDALRAFAEVPVLVSGLPSEDRR
jgi:Protein of unknown function (DUF2889)